MDTNKRPESMARITTPELADAFIAEQVEALRAQIGDKKVLLALSGIASSSHIEGVCVGYKRFCTKFLHLCCDGCHMHRIYKGIIPPFAEMYFDGG